MEGRIRGQGPDTLPGKSKLCAILYAQQLLEDTGFLPLIRGLEPFDDRLASCLLAKDEEAHCGAHTHLGVRVRQQVSKDGQVLRDVLSAAFGQDYGVTMASGPLTGLLARAVVVIGADGNVAYTELVPEITQEPDYEAALAAL